MEFEEYKKDLYAMKDRHEVEAVNLQAKYAQANNTIKLGDVVTDITILVDSIQTGVFFSDSLRKPQCVFRGNTLTKKGARRRDGARDIVWQQNIDKSAKPIPYVE